MLNATVGMNNDVHDHQSQILPLFSNTMISLKYNFTLKIVGLWISSLEIMIYLTFCPSIIISLILIQIFLVILSTQLCNHIVMDLFSCIQSISCRNFQASFPFVPKISVTIMFISSQLLSWILFNFIKFLHLCNMNWNIHWGWICSLV